MLFFRDNIYNEHLQNGLIAKGKEEITSFSSRGEPQDGLKRTAAGVHIGSYIVHIFGDKAYDSFCTQQE